MSISDIYGKYLIFAVLQIQGKISENFIELNNLFP